MTPRQREKQASGASIEIIVLLLAAALLTGFVAMRYRGLWGEADTDTFSSAIRAMMVEAQLVPSEIVYPHGYAFSALAVYLVRITGLTVAQLQVFGSALLAVWLVLPAWLAYRELTGSSRGATLATAIILVQPEFLFVVTRGTHEKFTRGLMFLCLYLLVRSIETRRQLRLFLAFLVAFYLAVYSLITYNNLVSISFIIALFLSLVFSLFVRQFSGRRSDDSSAARRRLLYAILISLVLAFFFTFYAYPPARNSILFTESVGDRIALLILDVEEVAENPYQTVSAGWTSLPVYFIVSIANWLLLIVSFAIWSMQSLFWLIKRAWPEEPRPILLWSLYGAFGFLGLLAVVSDLSGGLAGNLQHRIFPSFAMIAAAVVADWFVNRKEWQPITGRLAYTALALGIAFLGVVAVAKTTSDPAISNMWLYYAPSEYAALDWTRETLPGSYTWTGTDARLRVATSTCCNWQAEGVLLEGGPPNAETRAFLRSDVNYARARRLNLPLPIEGDSLRIYDNGSAEIYRKRPRTPFQK